MRQGSSITFCTGVRKGEGPLAGITSGGRPVARAAEGDAPSAAAADREPRSDREPRAVQETHPVPRAADPSPRAADPDGPTSPGWARCLLVTTCMLLGAQVFNNQLPALVGQTAWWTRDVSTVSDIVLCLVTIVVVKNRPAAVRPVAVGVAASVCAVVSGALLFSGSVLGLPAAVAASSVIWAVTGLWALISWMTMMSQAPRPQMFACVFASCLASSLLGYAMRLLVPQGPPAFVVATEVLLALAVIAGAAPWCKAFFSRLVGLGAPADREVSQPGSFLGGTHTLFVYAFIFSLAMGFALRSRDLFDTSPMLDYALTGLAVLVSLVLAARQGQNPSLDRVFRVALCCALLGFFLVTFPERQVFPVGASLLVVGYMCFNLLMDLTLCSLGARTTSDAVPALCWASVVSYTGIVLGALLGMLASHAPGQGVPLGLPFRLSLMVIATALVVFIAASARRFGFDDAIAGVEEDRPMPQPALSDRAAPSFAQRCGALAERSGLTPRETDVFMLLARGNNAQRICEELGITRNTVKYHAKNIYGKTSVHSQQGLIDLVEDA